MPIVALFSLSLLQGSTFNFWGNRSTNIEKGTTFNSKFRCLMIL